MSDTTTQHAGPAVRASDAEREQTVALLQHGFTADLPAAQQQPPRSGMVLDRRLLCMLSCVHPPAGLVCWLLCHLRKQPAAADSLRSGA